MLLIARQLVLEFLLIAAFSSERPQCSALHGNVESWDDIGVCIQNAVQNVCRVQDL